MDDEYSITWLDGEYEFDSASDQQEVVRETNVLREHHEKLQEIISAGLSHHTCELFHDQLFQISDLEKQGIPYRQPMSSTTHARPQFCKDKDTKLGCAHAGRNEERFDLGSRTVDAPSRTMIQTAISSLLKHAPELLPDNQGVNFLNRIEVLGRNIAKLDTEMGNLSMVPEIRKEHTACVTELFEIAKSVDALLSKAIEQGKGFVSTQEAFQEHLDPNDPFAGLEEVYD